MNWRSKRLWLAVLLVLTLVGVFALRAAQGKAVQTASVSAGPLVQTVVVSGRVLSPAQIEIGSVVTGRVGRVLVTEGDKVEAGKLLIELERDELAAALHQAQATVTSAKARLANVAEVGLVTAEEQLEQAAANRTWQEAELKRTRDLKAQGFISQARVDEAQRAYQVAASQHDAALTQVKAQRASGTQAREAQARYREALAAQELAQAKLNQTHIVASAPGVILARKVEPGDIVQPGKRLLTLAASGETRLTAQIDEKNLPLVNVGSTATVAADAFPQQRFGAELYYLAPGVDVQRGTVEARFRVPQPPTHLRADMTVSIEIAGANKPRALTVPATALRNPSGDGASVLVLADGVATAKAVKVGLRGSNRIEIVDGVAEGDVVVLDASVTPGTRVRAAGGDAGSAKP